MFSQVAVKLAAGFNLRNFLLLLVAALVTTWYGLFWSVDYFSGLTGGLSFMDMQPTLTAAALFEQTGSYDHEATRFYLWWSMFDYAWPFITFTTMLFISFWLLQFLPASWQRRFPWLVGAAYLTVLMDWLENLGFAALVIIRPAEPLWLAQITLVLHAAKLGFNFTFNLGFFVVLAAVVVVLICLVARFVMCP